MTDAARLLPHDPAPLAPTPRAPGTVRVAGWLAIATAIFGLLLSAALAFSREALPSGNNVFFRQFFRHEPWHLAVLLAFGLWLVSWRPRDAATGDPIGASLARAADRLPVAALAAPVAVAALLLWRFAFHARPFSMDEFAATFQARIFATGRTLGELPEPWPAVARLLRPVFVAVSPDGAHWAAGYSPGYALLRAPFEAVGAGWLLNPLLGAASVLLIHRVALAVWPGERRWAWTAAALLAVSPQLLVTSGTAYAMPAHLALNLAWLALYLRGTRAATAAMAPLGALALALHNPFPHALFVAPFLLRLLRERRWGRLVWLAIVYGATAAGVLAWLRMIGRFEAVAAAASTTAAAAAPTTEPAAGGGSLLSVFAPPSRFHLFTTALSGVLLVTWHTPACVVGWAAAARRPLALPAPLRDAALGIGLTLVFYLFFPVDQGHGWGYRYSYAVVGNLVLLATAGLRALAAGGGERQATRLVAVSLALSLAAQLPLRALQVESSVRPLAAALDYVRTLPADAVTVPVDSMWYGLDLLRNDPMLRDHPVVLREPTPAALDSVRARVGRTVRVVRPDELTALGMERVVPRPEGAKFWDRPPAR